MAFDVTKKKAAVSSGAIKIGTVDYEIESGSVDITFEDLRYVPITGDAVAYPYQIEGGVIEVEGSITAAVDSVKIGTPGSDTLPKPASPTALVAIEAVILGTKLTFNAKILKMGFPKESSGVAKFTCSFKSSGEVSWAAVV